MNVLRNSHKPVRSTVAALVGKIGHNYETISPRMSSSCVMHEGTAAINRVPKVYLSVEYTSV